MLGHSIHWWEPYEIFGQSFSKKQNVDPLFIGCNPETLTKGSYSLCWCRSVPEEPPSTNESDEDDFDSGGLIDEAHQSSVDRHQADQLYNVFQQGYNSGSASILQRMACKSKPVIALLLAK